MMRSSDENSTRERSSSHSPEHQQIHFSSHVEDIDDGTCSRAHISDLERAQIWAALSKESSKSNASSGGVGITTTNTGGTNHHHSLTSTESGKSGSTTHRKGTGGDVPLKRRDSKVKKFGAALKRVFMNDQTVVDRRASRRRDSWDDIYRSKDAAKIRPIHEEYGIL